MSTMSTGSDMLQRVRKEAGWTLDQLAEGITRELGRKVSGQRVSQWEHDDGMPDFFQARAADRLLGGDGAILDAYDYTRDEINATPGVLARLARLEEQVGIDEPPPEPARVQPSPSRGR